jgi:hypothetical protein|tara:strand:+ start:5034 stop:5153 length:120 start_codon:yes stop_codon:yes gene_type:complete
MEITFASDLIQNQLYKQTKNYEAKFTQKLVGNVPGSAEH